MIRNGILRDLIVTIILVMSWSAVAFAQHIPDYSLTPSEMVQQQRNYSTAPINNNQIHHDDAGDSPFASAPILPGAAPGQAGAGVLPNKASTRFMDGYCDRNFRPAIASDPRYANLGNCLQQQKDQVCKQFQALPEDAKHVLDQTVSCTSSLLNGNNPDDQQAVNDPVGCTGSDTQRLQLLKKYWRDTNTSYALVFLPDDVLDSSSKCLRGR